MKLFKQQSDPINEISVSNGGKFGSVNQSAFFGGYQNGISPSMFSGFTGTKTFWGYGKEKTDFMNYYELRRRSSALFEQNLYARGIIRRLVTNIVTTGMTLEAIPDENILGISYEESTNWQEIVESRFRIWAKTPALCDAAGMSTFAQIQQAAKLEALVGGDCLVVHTDESPRLAIIPGHLIQSPLGNMNPNIIDGVEIDPKTGKHLRFHVVDTSGRTQTIEAYGRKSGRKIAYMVYGTDKRINRVRGVPAVAPYIQSLAEIDRNRDSAQKNSARSSDVIGFVERTNPDTISSNGIGFGGAQTKNTTVEEGGSVYRTAEITPGVFINSLAVGETLKAFQGQGHVNFGEFERTILSAVAWSLEVSPGILMMSFSSNYAASAGEKEEFKLFLNKERVNFGDSFLSNVYVDWNLTQHLSSQIKNTKFLEDYRKDPYRFGAWCVCDWSAAIKPSVDILKQTNALVTQRQNYLVTGARASRELNGTKYSDNIKQIKRENELIVDAARVVADFEKEYGKDAAQRAFGLLGIDIKSEIEDEERMLEGKDDE